MRSIVRFELSMDSADVLDTALTAVPTMSVTNIYYVPSLHSGTDT